MSEPLPSYAVHDDNNIIGFFGEYQFLSNFAITKVIFEGMEFNHVEGAFQAAKTFDLELRKKISLLTPKQAKRAGGRGNLVLRDDWDTLIGNFPSKCWIMKYCVMSKFRENKEFRTRLLETGYKHLEERNHWGDMEWGTNPEGKGNNYLGRTLMRVRHVLRAEVLDPMSLTKNPKRKQ